jgi:hypothetical protein
VARQRTPSNGNRSPASCAQRCRLYADSPPLATRSPRCEPMTAVLCIVKHDDAVRTQGIDGNAHAGVAELSHREIVKDEVEWRLGSAIAQVRANSALGRAARAEQPLMMASIPLRTRLRFPSREGLRWRAGNAAEKVSFGQRELRETLRAMVFPNGSVPLLRRRAPLTAVVVGRNDGYIPNFFECLYTTIRLNAARTGLSEVIFVEWAPPPDAPLLAPELCPRLPFVTAYVVPEEVKKSVWGKEDGFLEYHAKNVGIRRATMPWVVVTNADILFGGDTARGLRHLPADPRSIGLAQRYDVPWEPGGSRLGTLNRLRFERAIPFHEYGTGDFGLAHRDLWWQAGGYDEGIPELRAGCDVRGVAQLEAQGGIRNRVGRVLHVQHERSITERVSRGETYEAADRRGLPYRNPESWGLADCASEEVFPRVHRLEAG